MSNEMLFLVIIGWAYGTYLVSMLAAGFISLATSYSDYQKFSHLASYSRFMWAMKEVRPSYFWVSFAGFYLGSLLIHSALLYGGLNYFNYSDFAMGQLNVPFLTTMLIGCRLWLMVIADIGSIISNKADQ